MITMVTDSTKVATCDLSINPESKNNFKVPVKLRYQVRTAADLAAYDVLWWDPAAKTWRVVTTTRDKSTLTLSADLKHFSKYAIGKWDGKAGW